MTFYKIIERELSVDQQTWAVLQFLNGLIIVKSCHTVKPKAHTSVLNVKSWFCRRNISGAKNVYLGWLIEKNYFSLKTAKCCGLKRFL